MSDIPTVTQADLPDDAVLLDVREDDEWRAGHAPGAVHVPLGELPVRLADLPEQPVHVICRSGRRSAQAVAWLVDAVGVEAANVEGGMQAWAGAERPMVAEGDAPPTVA